MDFARILLGFCTDFARIWRRFCPNFLRILYGFCADYARILRGLCVVSPGFSHISPASLLGFCVDFMQILPGFCTNFVRILRGFRAGFCEDLAEILCKMFCVDFARMMRGFCQSFDLPIFESYKKEHQLQCSQFEKKTNQSQFLFKSMFNFL